MMFISHKKFFFLFKLKFNFLKSNYLCFFKHYDLNLINLCNRYSLKYLKIQSNSFKNLFFNKNKFFYLYPYILIYFNNLTKFMKILDKINNIYLLSYLGFFVNNFFLKKFSDYFIYYNNNFKLYIFIIYLYIYKYILCLFLIIYKAIFIFNSIYLKLSKKSGY